MKKFFQVLLVLGLGMTSLYATVAEIEPVKAEVIAQDSEGASLPDVDAVKAEVIEEDSETPSK